MKFTQHSLSLHGPLSYLSRFAAEFGMALGHIDVMAFERRLRFDGRSILPDYGNGVASGLAVVIAIDKPAERKP